MQKRWPLLVLACIFSGERYAIGEYKGPLYVEKVLPTIYGAVENAVGQKRAHAFFQNWTKKEVRFTEEKLRKILFEKDGELAVTKENLSKSHSRIVGTLGEAYGLAQMREAYRKNPSIKILDEIDYAIENGELTENNRRPDGLAYEIKGRSVYLHEVLESKIGQELDEEQIEGWFRRWKESGLVVEGKRYFSKDIVLMTPQGPRPLKGSRLPSAKSILLGVTATRASEISSRALVVGFSLAERKSISAITISKSGPANLQELEAFQNRHRSAAFEEVVKRLKAGEYPFPSMLSPDEKQARLGQAIASHWKGVPNLFAALSPEQRKEIQKKWTFDPKDPKGSARRASGTARYTKEIVEAAVVARLKAGKYPFPARRHPDENEASLGRAVGVHWKSIPNLFAALSPKEREMALELGYDPKNPNGSAKRAHGSARYSKETVKAAVLARLDAGKYPFPARRHPDENEASLGRAVGVHWKSIPNLFAALSPKEREMALELGYDPKNPNGSGQRASGSARYSKETVKAAVLARLDAGKYPFPSARPSAEEARLGQAIQRHWNGVGKLFAALAPQQRTEIQEKWNFDPRNPNGSGQRASGSARYSKASVKAAVMTRINAGKYPFPSGKSPDEEERGLRDAIQYYWKGIANLFGALPSRQRKEIERKWGYDPKDPVKSALRGRRAEQNCERSLARLSRSPRS